MSEKDIFRSKIISLRKKMNTTLELIEQRMKRLNELLKSTRETAREVAKKWSTTSSVAPEEPDIETGDARETMVDFKASTGCIGTTWTIPQN